MLVVAWILVIALPGFAASVFSTGFDEDAIELDADLPAARFVSPIQKMARALGTGEVG
jgi:hypothetical protein